MTSEEISELGELAPMMQHTARLPGSMGQVSRNLQWKFQQRFTTVNSGGNETGLAFQISEAYSRIVRSLEN